MRFQVVHWDYWQGILVAECFGEIDARFQARELPRSNRYSDSVQVCHLHISSLQGLLHYSWQRLFVVRCSSCRRMFTTSVHSKPCPLI